MSKKGIEAVLSRAMSDAKFAETLFTAPEKALAGFDLTSEELANVKGMSRADFDQFAAATPEERKSMAWNNHNETMLTVR